jgi:hypothetical protein
VFSNYAEANCPAASVRLPTLCLGDGSEPSGAAAEEGATTAGVGRPDGSSGPSGGGCAAAGGVGGPGGEPGEAAGPYWSLMFEISESALKPVNQAAVRLGGGTW